MKGSVKILCEYLTDHYSSMNTSRRNPGDHSTTEISIIGDETIGEKSLFEGKYFLLFNQLQSTHRKPNRIHIVNQAKEVHSSGNES